MFNVKKKVKMILIFAILWSCSWSFSALRIKLRASLANPRTWEL
jgi:hypothetical protein